MNLDFQSIVTNAMAARRKAELDASPQLTLGELIAKLEGLGPAVLERPIQFDFNLASGVAAKPCDVDSWRGSYCELAIEYGREAISGAAFLTMIQKAMGKTYEGYKGGDFVMGKTTPMWVAQWGNSYVEELDDQTIAVVGVEPTDAAIILNVKAIDY